jgi:predicted nuclease of restriction endonuclease-like (RecB) superfamily
MSSPRTSRRSKKPTTGSPKKVAAPLRQSSALASARDVGPLIERVVAILDEARSLVVRTVNSTVVLAYWHVGREIVDRPGGLAARRVRRAGARSTLGRSPRAHRQGVLDHEPPVLPTFYLTFRDRAPEIRHIGGGESRPVEHLERQIHTQLFARLLNSRDKAGVLDLARRGQTVERPIDLMKSPVVLDFLDLPDSNLLRERDLESALLNKLSQFLLELGKGFAFVARQKRLTFEDEEFYVDLVFYNVILKCYLLIDLKLGKLTHQDSARWTATSGCSMRRDAPTVMVRPLASSSAPRRMRPSPGTRS